ncbi:Ig-like domain-containing protein [Streptomyces sp. NPDC004266]|uniref:L,D-transpeptidase family protein n=1 Tax=Streptomyces sp. NPDC004266 TaxID=3364693 RepID=UPI0036BCB9A4
MLPIRTPRPALAAVALVVSLTACTAQAADGGPSGAGSGAGSSQAPPAKVEVLRKEAGSPVTVRATGGTLTAVKVVDAEGGALKGRTDAGGTSWVSDRKAAPGTSYTVEVTSRAADGKESTSRSSFTTPEPEKVNKVTLAPGKNTTVGIGHPLSIVFDLPVTRKADVERQLKVTTSNGTEGSWGWVKDYSGRDRVDWRPREYWKPGTKVTLEADLDGTDSGGGWFVRDYRTGFTVGAAQVVKVDLDAHRLTLERDGRAVRSIPVSGGTPGGDKRSWRGTAVLMAKEGTINMNSETVGLGDAYNKDVDYSMRLTWSGMYAHAAPWNAAYFGRANHSSGCIGMSDADASSFYASVNVGDPFEIKGRETKGVVAEGNGYGAWNVSWAAWKTKSALR